MRPFLRAIKTSCARLARALGERMHPVEDDAEEGWDEVSGSSPHRCAAALFRRAAEPLDGVHPDLAALLMANARRDEDLNARLTELADDAAIWRARESHFRIEAARLRRVLDAAQARAAAAEKAARGMRQDLKRIESRYVARCASALNEIREDPLDVSNRPDRTIGREGLSSEGGADKPEGEPPFRFRLTG